VTASIGALVDVADRDSGLASGLSNAAWMIGGALGTALASSVAVSRAQDYLAAKPGANPLVALTEGSQSAFWACVVVAVVGVLVALLLLGKPRRAVEKRLQPASAGVASE
jgi:hypothetical protein